MAELHSKSSRVRFTLRPVAALVGLLLQGAFAHAQDSQTTEPPLVLRPSPLLQEKFPADVRKTMPTFVSGDRTEGETDRRTVVEGNAELRRGDTVIRADRLEYLQAEDLANVRCRVSADEEHPPTGVRERDRSGAGEGRLADAPLAGEEDEP